MAYYTTAHGLQLADPLTIQAFETTVVNANFQKLDDAIVQTEAGIAARKLTPTRQNRYQDLLAPAIAAGGTFNSPLQTWVVPALNSGIVRARVSASGTASAGALAGNLIFKVDGSNDAHLWRFNTHATAGHFSAVAMWDTPVAAGSHTFQVAIALDSGIAFTFQEVDIEIGLEV